MLCSTQNCGIAAVLLKVVLNTPRSAYTEMTGPELFELYIDSYVNKGRKSVFWEALRTFDFSHFRLDSDELIKLWRKNRNVNKWQLWSNGSSNGTRSNYSFDPSEVVGDIERLRKGQT